MDVDQLFSVAGKSVVVTGGSRGIGLMIAEGFVRAGARDAVVWAASVAEALDAVEAGLADPTPRLTAVPDRHAEELLEAEL